MTEQDVEYSLVRNDVLNFLHGIGELNDMRFGDVSFIHEGSNIKVAKYWWRKNLREATIPTSEYEALKSQLAERDALIAKANTMLRDADWALNGQNPIWSQEYRLYLDKAIKENA